MQDKRLLTRISQINTNKKLNFNTARQFVRRGRRGQGTSEQTKELFTRREERRGKKTDKFSH